MGTFFIMNSLLFLKEGTVRRQYLMVVFIELKTRQGFLTITEWFLEEHHEVPPLSSVVPLKLSSWGPARKVAGVCCPFAGAGVLFRPTSPPSSRVEERGPSVSAHFVRRQGMRPDHFFSPGPLLPGARKIPSAYFTPTRRTRAPPTLRLSLARAIRPGALSENRVFSADFEFRRPK